MNVRVEKVVVDTHDTKTLFFVDAEEGGCPFDYQPGQYLTFRFDGMKEVRSYTMSSSPCEKDYFAVTIKTIHKGLVSRHLCEDIKVGDVLRARGPMGRFGYDPIKDAPHIVMVGAGSGVTPFLSMLREFTPHLGEPQYPETMTLLVSYRSEEDLIGWDLLQEVQKNPRVKIVITLTREHLIGFLFGRIEETHLREAIGDSFENRTYFVCGPEGLLVSVPQFLLAQGVEPACIKQESFF